MTTFWDTSAVINALVNPDVYDRLDEGQHISRPHVFAEFFAIMSGRGIVAGAARWKLTPKDAAAWLAVFGTKCTWVDLSGTEVIEALSKAQELSVQGARVYDYLHAEAAKKGKAEKFLTRNTNDFKDFLDPKLLEWP